MRIELLIVGFAVVLSGCTGSNRGKTVPVHSNVSSQAEFHAYQGANGLPATNTAANDQNVGIITAGDMLLITFSNLPGKPIDQRVKDDGTITLIFNQKFQAAGKRIDDLEKEIRDYYVPKYFADSAAAVRISPEIHFVYVDGEFRNPGRYAWTNGMSLKDAIDAAGGFNEFATHRVTLIRLDGTRERLRLRGEWMRTNNPALRPGDKIHNPRDLL